MAKALIYTALFGSLDKQLREPVGEITDCEFLCFTDRDDLKSDTWKIIHEYDIPNFFTFTDVRAFTYTNPRIKARILKTVLPVRIKAFNITNFFDKYEDQVYIWIDASMQLKQSPIALIEKTMKDADILAFQHPDRRQLEEEAHAAFKWRGANLERSLIQVASCRDRGFTSFCKNIEC